MKKPGKSEIWTINQFLLVLSLAVIAAGCSRKELPGPSGKILNWMINDLNTLDPARATDRNAYPVLPLSIEMLYRYAFHREPAVLEPCLAAAMPEISKDGLTYTIRLRRGIRFQDDPAFPGGKGRSWVRNYWPETQPVADRLMYVDIDLEQKARALRESF